MRFAGLDWLRGGWSINRPSKDRPPAASRVSPISWVRTRALAGVRHLRSMPRKRLLAALLSALSVVMLLGAGLMAGYPFYTDWRANRQQGQLSEAFASLDMRNAYQNGDLATGSPLTRLQIPKLEVDIVVVEGTSLRALAAGAGHYESTPLPGEKGNVAIAGHRNVNGKPFANLNELRPGDRVVLTTPVAKHTYEVTRTPWVIAPNDWSVVKQGDERELTLTTCHPYGSNKQRLVVRAQLISTELAA